MNSNDSILKFGSEINTSVTFGILEIVLDPMKIISSVINIII